MNKQITIFLGLLFFIASNLPAIEPLDPSNRWLIRDFYQYVYNYGSNASMDWTGNYTTGAPGTVSSEWNEATRKRVEYYRAMAGIPISITFDPQYNAACQQTALMMSAQKTISHYPGLDWTWYTSEGAEAAGRSNLALGMSGRDAVDGYMMDHGTHNYAVGHRRWILYPHTTVMGSGDAPGDTVSGGYPETNSLWVIPDNTYIERPQTRDMYVPWPPKGYVPAPVVYSRWSFSYPGADFANSTVSMQSGEVSIPLDIEEVNAAFIGERTIVWVPNGMSTESRVAWPTPEIDELITVTVDNVLINNVAESFSYDVIIFNPDMPSNDEGESLLQLPDRIHPTVPVDFPVATREWSEGVQARILDSESYSLTHGGENNDIPFILSIAEGYTPVQSNRVASGIQAYYLPNPDRTPQILTFDEQFLITQNSPHLRFESSLAWATEAQYASVDINLGAGDNWISIWSKSGLVESNSSFTRVDIDLSPWMGKTARFRFRYDFSRVYGYWDIDPHTGWAFDNITFSGLENITEITGLAATSGSQMVVATFESTDTRYLQAREFAFDGLAMDWGPALKVQPTAYTEIIAPLDTWVEDPVFGWISGGHSGWDFSFVMGWIYTDSFPWVWADNGWFYYIRGSVSSTLWLYSPVFGYAYTNDFLGGWFNHEPYGATDWKTFRN